MELLICIEDAGTRCKPGDVIHAAPDGWAWSELERSNPSWRIVACDITQVEADGLMAHPDGGVPGFRRVVLGSLDSLRGTVTREVLYAAAGVQP